MRNLPSIASYKRVRPSSPITWIDVESCAQKFASFLSTRHRHSSTGRWRCALKSRLYWGGPRNTFGTRNGKPGRTKTRREKKVLELTRACLELARFA